MNCFDYLVVAKKYADEILKEYKTLIRLDSSVSRGKLYQRHFDKLKEMVEFEDLFYSKLAKCEVDFMEEKVLKKHFVLEDASILDFSFQELEEQEETLAWNRVEQKLSRERIQKTYPDYYFSLEQIGMIPLTPNDMDNSSLDYLNKEAILTGCFNIALSQYICFDSIYSSSMKTSFIYISSYMNSAIEMYYLHHDFRIENGAFQNIIDFVREKYQDDSENYYIASKEFYASAFSDYIVDFMESSNTDYLNDSSALLSLSILKDGLYIFSQIAPISVSNMVHTYLLQWEGNPFVKSYLDKAVMASLTKRKENDKQKQFSKNR